MKENKEFWIDLHLSSVHLPGIPFFGGKDGRTEQSYIHVIHIEELNKYKNCLKDSLDYLEDNWEFELCVKNIKEKHPDLFDKNGNLK
jgi:hypothetical protein